MKDLRSKRRNFACIFQVLEPSTFSPRSNVCLTMSAALNNGFRYSVYFLRSVLACRTPGCQVVLFYDLRMN